MQSAPLLGIFVEGRYDWNGGDQRIVTSIRSHATAKQPDVRALKIEGEAKEEGELFLRLPPLPPRPRHLTLGHVAGQPADIVLEEAIFAGEFIVVGLDGLDAFCEGLQRRLEGFCLTDFINNPISLLGGISPWDGGRNEGETHSCNVCLASLPSLSRSAELRRGLMARASSGGNSSSSISISGWSRGTRIEADGLRLGWRGRSERPLPEGSWSASGSERSGEEIAVVGTAAEEVSVGWGWTWG